MQNVTRLTKSERNQIEVELALIAPPEPTLEAVSREVNESKWLSSAIDAISGMGRVLTLMVAEAIQSLAALIIAVLFAILEYQRVQHGSIALGQSDSSAALIAIAIVAANVIHPIYALRALRGQDQLLITQMTGRGYLEAFWNRLTAKPITQPVDLYHNPTLHLAASLITWTTVVLAVYDILGPLLNELFGAGLTRPLPIAIMELLMGLGLSIAGVFFLQSASHEIGVRTLTDQPRRVVDVLAERRTAHQAEIAALRDELTQRMMAAKIADKARAAQGAAPAVEIKAVEVKPERPLAVADHRTMQPVVTTNGNGKHSAGETL